MANRLKKAYYFYSLPIYICIVIRWKVIAKKSRPLEKYVNEIGTGLVGLYNMWLFVFLIFPIWYPNLNMPEYWYQDIWFLVSVIKTFTDVFWYHDESRLRDVNDFYEGYPEETRKRIVRIASIVWGVLIMLSLILFFIQLQKASVVYQQSNM